MGKSVPGRLAGLLGALLLLASCAGQPWGSEFEADRRQCEATCAHLGARAFAYDEVCGARVCQCFAQVPER
jgi:hypothetical protein